VTPIADSDDIAAPPPPGVLRYERFIGAGHGVGRDQPERYFAVLREFLTGIAA
jgi:pimeloyl-ACP methyl ester carboxylesterase